MKIWVRPLTGKQHEVNAASIKLCRRCIHFVSNTHAGHSRFAPGEWIGEA